MEDGRGARRGARRADRFDLRRVDSGLSARRRRQQGSHGLRRLIAVALSVVHQGLHLSHPLASTSMVVGIACPGLPAPNNDAAALCRVSTAQDCSPVSVAAGPIIMTCRIFWGRQLQIGDLGHLGQPVTQVFSTVPCFVPRTPTNTDSSAVRCRRAVPTQEDAGLPCLRRDRQPPSLCATGPRADTRRWPARRASPARPGRGRR